MARAAARRDDDGLAIRAAWLHYAGGLTQAEVARRLGVSPLKAHRLVASANKAGLVKVTIDGAVPECLRLEAGLAERFGLGLCRVAPDLGEPGLPLRALGIAGAAFLRGEVEAAGSAAGGAVIGVGHGRTLLAAIAAMPRLEAGSVRFVSLLGGLTRNHAANPHDVIHRLAERTGAEAHLLPVPFLANSAADRAVLLAQRGVREALDLAARAGLMVAGLGTTGGDAQLVLSRMVEPAEMREARAAGGVGEVLGHFFDRNGREVPTPLAGRIASPPPDALRGRRLVAIAGGAAKVAAIAAVLRAGVLHGLVTDERTALALAAGDGA